MQESDKFALIERRIFLIQQALEEGAMVFGEIWRYGARLNHESMELCGGIHVKKYG
jgi:alanyl-tRNA synthetase